NGSKATLSAVPTSRINTLINYLSSKSITFALLCRNWGTLQKYQYHWMNMPQKYQYRCRRALRCHAEFTTASPRKQVGAATVGECLSGAMMVGIAFAAARIASSVSGSAAVRLSSASSRDACAFGAGGAAGGPAAPSPAPGLLRTRRPQRRPPA